MRIEIEVTQDDIENGQLKSSTHCPIALAVKRQIQSPISVCTNAISISTASWNDNDISIKLLEEVQKFIKDFDSGREVKPFKFILYTRKRLKLTDDNKTSS